MKEKNETNAWAFYTRKDIQREILRTTRGREVAAKYAEKGFGRRPDILQFEGDILELARQGATSIHVSEEHWLNPLELAAGMTKRELERIRSGWDLIVDIDFEVWDVAKHVAKQMVRAIKDHGIKAISIKFSGNKGFHIGVPYEAFSKDLTINSKPLRNLFPEGIKRIVMYLEGYIQEKYNITEEIKRILEGNGEDTKGYVKVICIDCGRQKKEEEKNQAFICKWCRKEEKSSENYITCPHCGKLMQKIGEINERCSACEGVKFKEKIDLAIDTLLISQRHLYRSVYSLHEKSGLVSIPINLDRIEEFNKTKAQPEKVIISRFKFLDAAKATSGEADRLIIQAFDYNPKFVEEKDENPQKEFEVPKIAIKDEKQFPPCIRKILEGIQKDGKKRSVFILINFFKGLGWKDNEIQEKLEEWNKKNSEPLREGYIRAQQSWHRRQKEKIPPPNCANKAYYLEFGVCNPDNWCRTIKNPLQYTLKKVQKTKKSQAR